MAFSVAKLQQQATELDAELAAARYTARSADKIASATVTGQGKLIDLVIAEQALRGAHPQKIGPAVLEAVTTARRQSTAEGMVKLRAVVDKDQEWQPQSQQAAADPPVVARPVSRRAAPVDDDESFDTVDFVTDSGDPDDANRGRW